MSAKNGTGRLSLAMKKMPLLVLGRTWTRSAGVVLGDSSKSKSSERMSVKVPEVPMGMSERAFLIQKRSMAGRAEKPMRVQPMDDRMSRSVMPPASKAIYITKTSASTGGVLSACF